MKNTLKILSIWLILGIFYYALEGFWRIPDGGYANVAMLFVGGLCGLAVGSINQVPDFYNMKVISQSILGTAMTLLIELLSGLILNVWLGLGVWDYSNLPLNLLGQICLPFAFLWLAIMPFAIWLEDKIRHLVFKEGVNYSLKQIYWEFITFQ